MLKAEQIPDEVVKAFYASLACDECDRKAIAAAINAWPGMRAARNGSSVSLNPHIILPLPQQPRDE